MYIQSICTVSERRLWSESMVQVENESLSHVSAFYFLFFNHFQGVNRTRLNHRPRGVCVFLIIKRCQLRSNYRSFSPFLLRLFFFVLFLRINWKKVLFVHKMFSSKRKPLYFSARYRQHFRFVCVVASFSVCSVLFERFFLHYLILFNHWTFVAITMEKGISLGSTDSINVIH